MHLFNSNTVASDTGKRAKTEKVHEKHFLKDHCGKHPKYTNLNI